MPDGRWDTLMSLWGLHIACEVCPLQLYDVRGYGHGTATIIRVTHTPTNNGKFGSNMAGCGRAVHMYHSFSFIVGRHVLNGVTR